MCRIIAMYKNCWLNLHFCHCHHHRRCRLLLIYFCKLEFVGDKFDRATEWVRERSRPSISQNECTVTSSSFCLWIIVWLFTCCWWFKITIEHPRESALLLKRKWVKSDEYSRSKEGQTALNYIYNSLCLFVLYSIILRPGMVFRIFEFTAIKIIFITI
jgi:hypothetical protein